MTAMDLAEMNARNVAKLLQRRLALIEDLDWMRGTGEHPDRALVRLADVGYRYSRPDTLVKVLQNMDWPDDRTEQVAAVIGWLRPPSRAAVVSKPDRRGPRNRRRARAVA